MRTGAASGVATRLMARADARLRYYRHRIAGAHAAKCHNPRTKARKDSSYGRDQQRREQFAQEMTTLLTVPVTASGLPKKLCAMRTSYYLDDGDESGCRGPLADVRRAHQRHRPNFPQKRELDAEAVRRCDIIAADSRQQSREEAGDLIHVFGDELHSGTEFTNWPILSAEEYPDAPS